MIVGIFDLVGGIFMVLSGMCLISKVKSHGYIMLYGGIFIVIGSLIIIFGSYFKNKKEYQKLQNTQ